MSHVPVTVRLYSETYISITALAHYLNPVLTNRPACAAAKGNYHSMTKRNDEAPEPCPICAAIEEVLRGR